MPHLTSLPLKMIFTTYKSDAHPESLLDELVVGVPVYDIEDRVRVLEAIVG
jgi:hypothetical protein